MRKVIQFALSLALLLGVISFPHKFGVFVASALGSFWELVLTVGHAMPVPGVSG
jgi:hypothetical protein